MIKPLHSCYWSARKKTELIDGPDAIYGAGISLNVILNGFVTPDIDWFTCISGDFNDDVYIVGILSPNSFSQNAGLLEANYGVRKAFPKETVREYNLSDELLKQLGFNTPDELGLIEDFDDHKNDNILYQISMHDDCFGILTARNVDFKEQFIKNVLELHNYYLGKDINWSKQLPEIMSLFKEKKKIQIKSRRNGIVISWGKTPILNKLFNVQANEVFYKVE